MHLSQPCSRYLGPELSLPGPASPRLELLDRLFGQCRRTTLKTGFQQPPRIDPRHDPDSRSRFKRHGPEISCIDTSPSRQGRAVKHTPKLPGTPNRLKLPTLLHQDGKGSGRREACTKTELNASRTTERPTKAAAGPFGALVLLRCSICTLLKGWQWLHMSTFIHALGPAPFQVRNWVDEPQPGNAWQHAVPLPYRREPTHE
jgi:hypothetical protein